MPELVRLLVFLDIDGVLVTQRTLKGRSGLRAVADPNCVKALNHILAETDAFLVISSSWRFCGLEEMWLILTHWGVQGCVVGITPDLTVKEGSIYQSVPRGREIQAFIDELAANGRAVHGFVILDDDPDMEHLLPWLVKTQFETGLTMEHANQAIAILSAPRQQPGGGAR